MAKCYDPVTIIISSTINGNELTTTTAKAIIATIAKNTSTHSLASLASLEIPARLVQVSDEYWLSNLFKRFNYNINSLLIIIFKVSLRTMGGKNKHKQQKNSKQNKSNQNKQQHAE